MRAMISIKLDVIKLEFYQEKISIRGLRDALLLLHLPLNFVHLISQVGTAFNYFLRSFSNVIHEYMCLLIR